MIEVRRAQKFARYVHPRDIYDPPPGKCMFIGALIKKPAAAVIDNPKVKTPKNKRLETEGSVSCGSSDDDIIIIAPGAVKDPNFKPDSDVSVSEDDDINTTAPTAPKRQIEEIELKIENVV